MKHLTKNAGEFKGRCNLRRRVRWDRMTEELWVIANERGYERVFHEVESERRDKETGKHGRWMVVFAACGGLETDDAAAFEAHITELHDGGRKLSSPVMITPGRMWKGPKAPVEHRALVTKAEVEVCDRCGLVAEVDGSNASDLWWTEHQRGCAMAAAS